MESRIEQHVCSVQIALGVPTKAPIAGVAKTRLGRGLGYEVAAKLHRAFLLDAIAMLGRVSAKLGRVGRFLMCPDQQQAEIVRGFVGQSLTVEVQTRTGLMGCLTDVFDTGFGSGAQYAAAIASDIPGLPEGHILRCLELALAITTWCWARIAAVDTISSRRGERHGVAFRTFCWVSPTTVRLFGRLLWSKPRRSD